MYATTQREASRPGAVLACRTPAHGKYNATAEAGRPGKPNSCRCRFPGTHIAILAILWAILYSRIRIFKRAKLTVQTHSLTHARATPSRIVLTGFMGSGKTTVGPIIARLLGWQFVDVDDVIESDAGMNIAQIFARDGEGAFRDREQATIAQLATGRALVIALGGGAIERKETRDLLLETPETLLVHLEVELGTTLTRCRGTEKTRPVLADRANLETRYRRRLPLYRTAHINLVVDTLTPEQVAAEILLGAGFKTRSAGPNG